MDLRGVRQSGALHLLFLKRVGRQEFGNMIRDPARRSAVAIGEGRPAHGRPDGGIEQSDNGLDDPSFVRSDQQHVAAGNALRPLGLFAQNEHRDAERRRFLLHAAGIAEENVACLHGRDHLPMAERLEEANPDLP